MIVFVLLKYWDQTLIEKSMLSSYQKIKSKLLLGVGQDIYVTNKKFNEENQALRKEISWLNTIIINNISHIMEKIQNPTKYFTCCIHTKNNVEVILFYNSQI